MSNDTTEHNGWTNYATWRVNLEMFDTDDNWDITEKTNPFELSQRLKESVICFVDETCELAITRGWAIAFLDEVNFYEIAEKLIENHKESQ